MKYRALAVALICFGSSAICGSAQAAPYFRVYGWDYSAHTFNLSALSHPTLVAGALIDPTNLGNSSGASLLPLVTHSPSDGCILPGVVCEDWTPLAVGASLNAGKVTFDVAPLFNVFPWMVSALKSVTPANSKAAAMLQAAPSAGDPITFSAGPVWEYSQLNNKGYFKVFTGLALHF